jgi:hypothetical protein
VQRAAQHSQALLRSLGLQQRLALRKGEQTGAGQRIGEVRRVAGHLAGQHRAATQVGELLAIDLEGRQGQSCLLDRRRLVLVGEQLHLTAKEGAGAVGLEDPQALTADDLDVEPAIVVRLEFGQLHQGADPVRGLHPVVAHLVALADREDAEDAVEHALDGGQLPHQRPVALLEDVQRSDHPREHHRVQREQRHLGHRLNLVPHHRDAVPYAASSVCPAGL